MEFCRKNGIKRVMNFSSSRVLSPERNPYVASKLYGEELVKAYHDCYGIEFITVRPSTVFGPTHDITSRLITTWIQDAMQGKTLRIFGDRQKTLDFTYVDDFVDGIELLTDRWDVAKNEAYNISGHEEVALKDLAKIIGEEVGKRVRVRYEKQETAQPQRVSVDISKMQALGYNPKVGIREGVRRMVKFYNDYQEDTA